MRVLTVVNSTVDTDGPHARGVSIAITIVLLSAVTGSPDVNVTQTVSTLIQGERERERNT